MLTIENVQRLKNKVIGKTGYYVSDVMPVVLVNPETFESTHFYHIELANRNNYLIVRLNREGVSIGNRMKLYEMKLGQNYINLNKFKLRNMDLVIENINKLLLQHWLP